jgi:SAM-dependent methyltransferase
MQTTIESSMNSRTAQGASETDRYYRENAQSYFDRTFGLQMAHLYRPFLAGVGKGRRILDVGCGSGRDVKAFRALGYDAYGIDPSPELVDLATKEVGPYFSVGRAESYSSAVPFDAIWACASLLHVRRGELYATIRNLRALLSPQGVFFASMQLGSGEVTQADGRRYTYFSAGEFEDAIAEAGLQVLDAWESKDVLRSDGPRWINVLARGSH